MIVYPVTAYRNGNREKHSYLVGVYSTAELAKDAAEHEEEDRGGKYCCEIVDVTMDDMNDSIEYFKMIKPLRNVIQEWRDAIKPHAINAGCLDSEL